MAERARALNVKLPKRNLGKRSRAASAAQGALQQEDFSFETVLRILRLWSFEGNQRRANVTRGRMTFVYSDSFGLVPGRGRVQLAKLTRAFPNIPRLLCGVLKAHCPDFWERGLTTITITINKGRRGQGAARHRDVNNEGAARLIVTTSFEA